MSTPCDGGYGAILCVPHYAIYFDMECSDQFTDLCIESSHVEDALSMGAVCGHCPAYTTRQLARKLPCSSIPPIVTKTYIKLDDSAVVDLFSILAETTEDAVSTDQLLYNVTKEISSLTMGNETFLLEGGRDAVAFQFEESDVSVTVFSNGTVAISGGKEPGEFCFDYTVTSREANGKVLMLGMATVTGTHCVNIRPQHAYTATVSEIDELPDHSIAQSILTGMSDGNSSSFGSIVQIIVPMDGGDNSEVIVPRAGEVIVLPHGNMTIDPIEGIMVYTPNPALMESLGEGDVFTEYFDYVLVDQNGTSSMERVTIKVVGEGSTSTTPSSVPSSAPTIIPSSKPSSLPSPKPTNFPPVAEDNAYGRTVEQLNNDGGRIVGEILTNDSDPDGRSGDLTVTSISHVGPGGEPTTISNAALNSTTEYPLENGKFNIDPSTGSIVYTPDPTKVAALDSTPGSVLTDTLTYVITDKDGGTDIATVTFTIVGQNDPPVPQDDSETVPEGDDVSDCVL